MSELTVLCNDIHQTEDISIRAKTIYALCKSVTPQFYMFSGDELVGQVNSIAMLIKGIRKEVLSKMCELAIENYPKARAEGRTYMDINYILSFYKKAWEEARPPDYSCFAGLNDKGQICWCRDIDFDWDNNRAKHNAKIWVDESYRGQL